MTNLNSIHQDRNLHITLHIEGKNYSLREACRKWKKVKISEINCFSCTVYITCTEAE